MEILYEAKNSKYVKRYPCPYCKAHYDRQSLITHIERNHDEEIPEGYSATRVVFNYINKKDHGNCVICQKITNWNPKLARYDRFCSEQCRDKYIAIAKQRMIDTYGKESLLNDPEHQKKMIANRKISGTYKFSSGGSLGYTGSYEKKALEFMDKVMEYKVGDIVTPGPVIEYTFKGQKHFWITDIYIPSYELCIDVKDGGKNPNRREMEEYRLKQIAKEEAIIKSGKYNYLRLTDNNFGQLMGILAELKMQLLDKSPERLIRINENMFASIGGMLPMQNQLQKNNVYICNYMMNNIFNSAVSDDPYFETAYVMTYDGVVRESTAANIFGSSKVSYNMYKYENDNVNDIMNKLHELSESKEVQDNSLLEIVFDKEMYSLDEWKCYDSVSEVNDYFTFLYECRRITRSTLLSGLLKENSSIISVKETNFDEDSDIVINEDSNGYFLENKYTKMRTPSQNSDNFSEIQRSIISGGFF